MIPLGSKLLHEQPAIDRVVAGCYCPRVDIRSFIEAIDSDQRQEFADRAGTNTAYLSQLASGHRKASTSLARRLVQASMQVFPGEPEQWLTLDGIRPDIWTPDEAA